MSDFGTLIQAEKKDKTKFSGAEQAALCAKLEQIINEGLYESAGGGEKFNHEFAGIQGDDNALLARLSEHYLNGTDEEDEENYEFVEEIELPDAEEIVEKLRELFPDYDFEASVEEW